MANIMASEDSHRITQTKDDSHSRGANRSPTSYSDEKPSSSKRTLRDRDTSPTNSARAHRAPSPTPAKPYALKLSAVTGGRYIPPGRLRLMQQQITDKSSTEYQMLSWNALKRSINGIINKANVSNITSIVEELFNENLIRGRGLLAQSVMQAQMFSPIFSKVYACLVAIINTKLPSNGELILHRLVMQFKRSYRRRNKSECVATVKFIAHLVNQGVAHELLALQVLTLLLDNPTDDSIELCIAFLKESGQKLKDISSRAFIAVNETLRNVLHEGKLQVRVLYMVETYLKILKDGFKEHPSVIPELDLVPEEDQITHLVSLEDTPQAQTELNVFKADPDFTENEAKYQQLKGVILGEGSEEGSEEGSGEDESSESEKEQETILDNTGTNEIQFRRTMYLTLMSSINFEETAHKIFRLKLPDGSENGVLSMVLECACQERSYMKYFGLTAQRLCMIRRPYVESAGVLFRETFSTVHRLESNKLRNAARFFAHLLYSDAIPWTVLDCIHLNEEETSASSRIFIKILFQELAEYMGLLKLNERLNEPQLSAFFAGLFSRENPKHSRFSVNFFTTIGLGGLTEGLREFLKTNAALQQLEDEKSLIDSSDDDSDSENESTSSSSSSEAENTSPESLQPGETTKQLPTENPHPRPDLDRRLRSQELMRGGAYERDRSPYKEKGERRPIRERSRSPHEERFSPKEHPIHDKSKLPYKESRQDRRMRPRRERSRSPYKEIEGDGIPDSSRSPYKESRRSRNKHVTIPSDRSDTESRASRRDRNKPSAPLEDWSAGVENEIKHKNRSKDRSGKESRNKLSVLDDDRSPAEETRRDQIKHSFLPEDKSNDLENRRGRNRESEKDSSSGKVGKRDRKKYSTLAEEDKASQKENKRGRNKHSSGEITRSPGKKKRRDRSKHSTH